MGRTLHQSPNFQDEGDFGEMKRFHRFISPKSPSFHIMQGIDMYLAPIILK